MQQRQAALHQALGLRRAGGSVGGDHLQDLHRDKNV